MELQFQIVIDPALDRKVSGAVAFGDFEVEEGAGYPAEGLPAFFYDLVRGRAMPTALVARKLTPSVMVAITLFLHRELTLRPQMLALVASCGMVDQLGLAGLAHIDRDLASFFKLLVAYLPEKLGRKERQEKLQTAVEWVRQYVLRGELPALPAEPDPPRILDVGSGGFVLAEATLLEAGWLELFRQGFLWGVLLTPSVGDRRGVLAARKSLLAPLDMRKAAGIFNEAEKAMGEPDGWKAEDLWLWGPEGGTLLLPTHIVDVVIRVGPSFSPTPDG